MKSKLTFNEICAKGQRFLKQITDDLEKMGIPASKMNPDHLCFRVKSLKEYGFYKQLLAEEGTLLKEAIINGRPISTFRLKTPITTKQHTVDLIELPAPKKEVSYETSFEHIEFVINESFASFIKKYPNLKFSKPQFKTINSELNLKTQAGLVKFHYQSLDRIIEIEESKVKDIIFDFDGTLLKSRDNIYEINRIVFSDVLDREVSLEESRNNFHPEFSNLFKAYNIVCEKKQERALSIWGEVSQKFQYSLFDGATKLLQKLDERGYNLHLWTARDKVSALSILRAYGIENIFKTLSFANNKTSKPHVDSLNFQWNRVNTNSVIMIGDSPSDIIGAKNIGAIGAAALWDPYVDEQALVSAGAELFFKDFKSIQSWLLKQ